MSVVKLTVENFEQEVFRRKLVLVDFMQTGVDLVR